MNSQLEPPRASPQTAAELMGRCRDLVRANGRRWQLVILLEALGLAIAAPLAYLWFIFFLDNQLHLSFVGRLLGIVGFLMGTGWACVYLARRWLSIYLSEDQIALAIERGTPGGIENRLINALQLSRTGSGNDRLLSAAVVEDNCRRLEQMHLEQAARMRPAVLRVGLGGLLIGIGVAFWVVSPEHFANAATRFFLPLAQIDPLYRTTLLVEPGDMEAAGDAVIHVTIKGERPAYLTLFKNIEGKRTSEKIPVQKDDGPVAYTFRDVNQNIEYAVQGGDFTSDYYHIEMPRKTSLLRVRIAYQYPLYTRLPEKYLDGQSGDLEALQGTRAKLTFVFNHPVDQASISLDRPGAAKNLPEMRPLTQISVKEFAGEILLQDISGYRLEMQQGNRPIERTGIFGVRILKDQEPKLELLGIERRTEVQVDSILPVKLSASDDFGLEKVGLFYRRRPVVDLPPAKSPVVDEGWQPVQVWSADQKAQFHQGHELALEGLQASEGDKIELAVRALDTDPSRQATWTTGNIHELTVGGDGVALQLQYEQIVQSEKDLKSLLVSEQELLTRTVTWIRKLDGGSDIRWDDGKNIDLLHTSVKQLRTEQDAVRQTTGKIARAMVPQVGNLRPALGLLADAEMDRLSRMFDAVPSRDQPQTKRAALADARLTQERIIRSIQEMLEQYQAFRSDWELSNMIPFTKMLSERQTKLRDQSRTLSSLPLDAADKQRASGNFLRQSAQRRQLKVLGLCQLVQPAFTGLSARLAEQETTLASAFQSGAKLLASDSLLTPMSRAAAFAQEGRWNEATTHQSDAAAQLVALHELLRKAQVDAAQKALAALKEKLKSDLESQKELEKLPPGTAEAFLKEFPDTLKLEDLMRIQEVTGAKKRTDASADEEPNYKDAPLVDVDRNKIELKEDSGVYQDPYSLKLGTIAEKTPILNLPKDQKENAVKPFIQEKFDDLVGKLLDETEELHKNYQTLKLSTNQNNNDPGEIGKVGGTLNSTGAVAATGNKKPPTTDSGGLSRTGRQGARAHGMVADDEGVDRRGRDKALEGQEQVADQAGTIKMKKSDDMQKDSSTGVGGKKVESDDTHFSLHDAGKWKDEFTKRMEKPQKKQYIVERQGDKFDARTAALLRDLTSKQEQVIERLKAIKKELRNLYLPTDHLDELAAALDHNLASLKEQPDPELFRQQVQTLDRLRGAMRVFRNASSSFQPSLPRDRALHGRVLDEPPTLALPGYEDAVRQYYLKLAAQ